MKTITKALVGTAAAGAMAMTSAAPAFARDRDRGVDAGDIIAGAVILGGIAAIASAAGKRDRYDNRRYRDGHYYRGDRYQRRGNPRRAVEKCVRAAERDAQRYGYRYADVTQIRDVDDTRYGWRVKGRLVVDGARGYRGGDRYYRGARHYRGDRYDRRGYRSADSGKFTCYIERGRVSHVDYSGIRGLR